MRQSSDNVSLSADLTRTDVLSAAEMIDGRRPVPRGSESRPGLFSFLAAGDVGKGRYAELGADLTILLDVSRDFICAQRQPTTTNGQHHATSCASVATYRSGCGKLSENTSLWPCYSRRC